MPKRSSDKEQEVLGQIFDFIFKEAKKRPEKRKPIKVSGLNGKGMLTDGIAAALERPGVFLTQQAAKDLNDALDITLTKFKPNQNDPTAPVKISIGTLPDIFRDPMGVMQKAKDRADANRKSGKAAFIGKVMREFVTNGWARQYADLDTQQAIRLGLESQNLSKSDQGKRKLKQQSDTRAALGQAASGRDAGNAEALTNMQERGATLIGRNVFTERAWNSFSNEERSNFGRIFSLAQNSDAKKTNLTDRYVSEQLKKEIEKLNYSDSSKGEILRRYDDLIKNLRTNEKGQIENISLSLSDSAFYRKLEIGNIDDRIKFLTREKRNNLSPAQLDEINYQIDTLDKSKLIIKGQDLTAANFSAASDRVTQSITSIRNQIRVETDATRKAQLNRRLKDLKNDKRELSSMAFWQTVGQREGQWGSFKDNIINGNLISNIWNGDFFDPDKNNIAPSSKVKGDGGLEYFVPKVLFEDKHGNPKTNKLLASYNTGMTHLYYLTPKCWMRTLLFNGEGFAYVRHLKSEQIKYIFSENSLMNSFENKEGVINAILGGKSFADILADKNLSRLVPGKSLSTNDIQVLQNLLGGKQMQYLLRGRNNYDKLQKFFGRNAAFKKMVADKIETFMKVRRTKLIEGLMKSSAFKKFFSSEAAGKLLSQWIEKGGLQNISRALVIAVANALGFAATGGLANIIVTAVAGVVSDMLFTVGKVLFGIIIFSIIGLVGLMFMVSSQQNTAAKQTYAYANTNPGEVVTNPNYKGTSPITEEEDDGMADFIGGTLPDGQKCLLDSSAIYCSQGAFGSYSHANVAAIDLSTGATDFYAPQFCGDNNCKVTFSGTTTCTAGSAGGMIIFTASYGGNTYEFKLIHVKAASGIGVGTYLDAGQQVARVMPYGPETKACSSGTHIHLQTKLNGKAVDPWEVMTSDSSNGGFACNISACDP